MADGASVWAVLWVGLIAANLPFVTERVMLLGPSRHPKPWFWRAAELLLMAGLTIGLGFALEARIGQRQPQGWEFYAAFAFLFLTFAFPGFVWRYLMRRSA
jgi:hypothetical protein